MTVRLIGLLRGKDFLDALEEVPTALLGDGGQYRRDLERLPRLRERHHVVDDQRRFVAVQVGELKRLVIDEQKYAALRRKQRVESSLDGRWHSPFQSCFQYDT
jgi:hypothetical protein